MIFPTDNPGQSIYADNSNCEFVLIKTRTGGMSSISVSTIKLLIERVNDLKINICESMNISNKYLTYKLRGIFIDDKNSVYVLHIQRLIDSSFHVRENIIAEKSIKLLSKHEESLEPWDADGDCESNYICPCFLEFSSEEALFSSDYHKSTNNYFYEKIKNNIYWK